MAESPDLGDLSDSGTDPPVSSEDLEAWLAELNPSDEDEAEAEPSAAVEEEEADDDQDQQDQPEHQDHFVVAGNEIARADIERLYEFDRYLRANPDVAQRVAEAVNPPRPPADQPPVPAQAETPAYEEPTPPEYLDLDDPAVRFTWESHLATQRQLFESDQRTRAWIAEQQRIQQSQLQRQAALDMESALSDFRTRYPGLSDDDIATVRTAATAFVPQMMEQLPPVQALTRSMEVAAWADADLRPRLGADSPSVPQKERSVTRKQRLSSISGSARSAPKTEDRVQYSTDKDMVNALANAIAEQGFNGNN